MMDTSATGMLLREVARLHVQLQREGVSRCDNTTATQCAILTELGRSGEMTLAELGRRVGLDKGWVSRTVEGLSEEGLVNKVPSETDRRAVLVALSAKGEIRFQSLNQTLNAQAERVINHIPAEDRECVFRALHALQLALQNERQTMAALAASVGVNKA
jgi:DNA-binding MarR family transcriptional regulator